MARLGAVVETAAAPEADDLLVLEIKCGRRAEIDHTADGIAVLIRGQRLADSDRSKSVGWQKIQRHVAAR